MTNAASHISVIAPPLADAPEPSLSDDLVTTPNFWPDLSIENFRKQARADDTFTDPRIRGALQSACETVLLDLRAWSLEKMNEGHNALADVPAEKIDGTSRLTLCFIRATFAYAKAELVETYRDFDATGKGNRNEAWSDDTISQLKPTGKHAIRDILGKPHLYSGLI